MTFLSVVVTSVTIKASHKLSSLSSCLLPSLVQI